MYATIKECENDPFIPTFGFNFTDLGKVKSEKRMDVVGVITNVVMNARKGSE